MRVNALVKRGSLHMQHERVDDSLRDFDKAALLDPSNCDVFHHRGQVSFFFKSANMDNNNEIPTRTFEWYSFTRHQIFFIDC